MSSSEQSVFTLSAKLPPNSWQIYGIRKNSYHLYVHKVWWTLKLL